MPTAKMMKASAPKTPGKKATGAGVVILDNENDSFTVMGVDGAGNPVDISSVATMTAVSDTPGTVTVTTTGMTGTVVAVGPLGTANLTVTATWNDGSIGPFSITVPVTVAANPATTSGIGVTFGTPVVNP
jgi:hypothetical protein